MWLRIYFFLALFMLGMGMPLSQVSAASGKKAVKRKIAPDPAAEARKKELEQNFQKAEASLYAGKTDKALPALSSLCEKDYLRACSLLGFAYNSGRYGVEKDFETGVEWYEKCVSKEKNFFCSNELGRIYYRRNEYDKALEYYRRGAKAGNSKAEYWLGRLYLEGKGVPAKPEQALSWFRRAAHDETKPIIPAQCVLVEMSYYGIGMRPSAKDTNYWLEKCDDPFIRSLRSFYGHGVPKDKNAAKKIMQQAKLNEALADWDDFNGNSRPSVGKKTIRDQSIPEDCSPKELLFGARRKSPKIETYAVKIFHPDYYRSFDIRDGYSEKGSNNGDQTFEACRMTFYTTSDNKKLFNKALEDKAVIKISLYKNACLGAEMTGVCDLNLSWQKPEEEE